MKKISLILAFIMVFNLLTFNIAAVNAASESTELFNFNDVAYSASLGMFIATANVGVKGYILASADGEKWAVVRSFTSTNMGYGDNDCVVWWQSQGVFAVYTRNSQIWTSSDGYNWANSGMTNVLSSGGITADGDNLIIFGGAKIRIYSNYADYQEMTYTTTANMYATLAVSAGEGSTKTIMAVAAYRGGVSVDGGAVWTEVSSFAAFGTIKDAVYSKNQDCFYTAVATQGWKISKIERSGAISGASNISGIGSARSNAITVGNNKMVIGTDDGKLYWAPDDSTFSMTSTQWTAVPSIDENANSAPIKRIVYGNGKFVGVANKNVSSTISLGAIVVMRDDMASYKKINTYESSPYEVLIEGESRVEIPSSTQPSVTFDYSAKIVDLKNNILGSDSIVSFAAVSLPNGITFGNGKLTVASSAAAGSVVTLRATSKNGLTKDFNVKCVKETSIKIIGSLDLAIPAYGDPNEKWEFTAKVLGDDGEEMQSRSATISLTSPVLQGASFDVATSSLTLSYNTVAGEITIKAVSNSEPTVFVEKTITVRERMPASVEVTSGKNSIVIPDSKSLVEKYSAVVKDQTNKLMPNLSVVWTVTEETDGVSVNAQTGDLTISTNAFKGTIVLRAAVAGNSSVYKDYSVELSFTDLRSVTEDKNALSISGDLTKVTSNLTLPTTGTYGSKITWTSGSPSLITNAGAVTQATDSHKQVNLTATVTKGKSSSTRSFVINVLKLENIFKNSGFEDASTSPWKATGAAAISADSTSPHLGTKSLLVSARAVSTDGAAYDTELKNNATYLFEGYVKAKAGSENIGVTSKESSFSKIAEVTANADNYTKLSGTYTYTNKEAKFSDVVEISSRFSGGTGDFYIDDFRLVEITVELSTLMSAIQKAEYSRLKSDIKAAQDLLDAFFDTPLKNDLQNRINGIVPKETGGSSGSGGGGGGGSKGQTTVVSVPSNAVQIPNNTETVSDYLLIFKDLKNHWAKDDIEFMAKKGFVKGSDKETFLPEDYISRAEFVALIVRTMGISPKTYENSFYDVVEEDWYSGYVQAARDAGYVVGSNGLFKPDGQITREEMTKIIVMAYNQKMKVSLTTGGALYYNDIYNISSWAYDYIVSAVNLELVNGVTEDTFSPSASATRAQAAVILKRLYDKTMAEKTV